jgi:hypothetical protein
VEIFTGWSGKLSDVDRLLYLRFFNGRPSALSVSYLFDFFLPNDFFSWCSTSQSCMNSFEALQCSEFMRVTYGFDCPFRAPDSQPYLDIFARSRALPFISAAK